MGKALCGGPILDIAIAIDSFQEGMALVDIMAGLGYRYRGENGISGRHYFVRGSPCRTIICTCLRARAHNGSSICAFVTGCLLRQRWRRGMLN